MDMNKKMAMTKVRGEDSSGERQKLYDWLEVLAQKRQVEEMGRGLTSIVRQMNYVETHNMGGVVETYPALVKNVLGRQRFLELNEGRTAMNREEKIASKLVAGKSGSVVLREDDFRNKDMWYAILDAVGLPHGEEADFNEPEEVTLRVTQIR